MKGIIHRPLVKLISIFAILAVLAAFAGVLMLALSPATGAYGAETLRRVIGEQAVANMEMGLFQLQDTLKSIEYHLGLSKPADPFNPTVGIPISGGEVSLQQPQSSHLTSAGAGKQAVVSSEANSSAAASKPLIQNAQDWTPPVISGQDAVSGSQWQPYLQDASGKVIAYRAYLQPDPTRPYAYTAIVAFDLRAVRLHYMIGLDEPYAPGVKKTGTGSIPATDTQSGLLLAAFNGGFKYEHGNSGSMADGFISAPPRDGFGTLAIYRNGEIKIGEWGKDIQPSADMVAFRQNGPLLIQDGQVNQQMLADNPAIWGRTITGGTATFRSGIAISPDGRTLYYFAGQFLSAPVLANAMELVHPKAGIQLDINNYWVFFTSFQQQNGQTVGTVLLPKAMVGNTNRFLLPYSRDFFYVTVAR